MLTIAIAKGRVFEKTISFIKKIGLEIAPKEIKSRKIIMNTNFSNIKILVIRSADIPVFVQHGAADIGIVGKDVLVEHGANGIFELLDLGIAKCSLMVASKNGEIINKKTLKIATKYINSSKKYFQDKAQQVEIIKLYGAMEIAPNIGLADYIVDLVETGNTIKANGLKTIDKVYDVSSRLIVNSASFNTKHKEVKDWLENIKSVI